MSQHTHFKSDCVNAVVSDASKLQECCNGILSSEIDWTTYVNSRCISNEDNTFLVSFKNTTREEREALLDIHRTCCARAIINILRYAHEKETINYILVMSNEIFKDDDFKETTIRCLQVLLRRDEYRYTFEKRNGIAFILEKLNEKINFQIHYQLIFCIWEYTFNSELARKNVMRLSVIPVLVDLIKDTAKEKVNRIAIAVLKNLILKLKDPAEIRNNLTAMAHFELHLKLELIMKIGCKDEDMLEDIAFLLEQIENLYKNFSSVDIYRDEIQSGDLHWSPLHKSNSFWAKNVSILNENNFELLRCLLRILSTSTDPLVISVACSDIGHYAQHCSEGKSTLENFDGKEMVMGLLEHEDPRVKYEALVAVQKIMLQSWEDVGRLMRTEEKKKSRLDQLRSKYLKQIKR